MSNDTVFLENKEKETMEKLLDVASRMIRAEEIARSMAKSLTVSGNHDNALREYLLQKAEIARLGRQVDEVIRNHEIQCHDCGEVHKLREVAPLGTPQKILLRCPQTTPYYAHLGKAEAESLERILRFAQVEVKSVFDTKVP